MLYTLNLYGAIGQLYCNKTEKKKMFLVTPSYHAIVSSQQGSLEF